MDLNPLVNFKVSADNSVDISLNTNTSVQPALAILLPNGVFSTELFAKNGESLLSFACNVTELNRALFQNSYLLSEHKVDAQIDLSPADVEAKKVNFEIFLRSYSINESDIRHTLRVLRTIVNSLITGTNKVRDYSDSLILEYYTDCGTHTARQQARIFYELAEGNYSRRHLALDYTLLLAKHINHQLEENLWQIRY